MNACGSGWVFSDLQHRPPLDLRQARRERGVWPVIEMLACGERGLDHEAELIVITGCAVDVVQVSMDGIGRPRTCFTELPEAALNADSRLTFFAHAPGLLAAGH